MLWPWLGIVMVLGTLPRCGSAQPASPYVGQEQQEIKALSAEDIHGYLSGSGMGLAKVAELHHYPGPRHVLDLAQPLQLTEEQQRHTQAIFEAMHTKAVRVGQQLLDQERHLDALFAAGTITEAQVEHLVAAIATTHGHLQVVHLRAHLAQKPILTLDQLRRYDMLRGYEMSRPHTTHPQHGH
jgi:Spy/CpxP family protein refolding chaperone